MNASIHSKTLVNTANHEFDWQVMFRPASLSEALDSYYVYLLDKNDLREHIEAVFIGYFYPGPSCATIDAMLDEHVPVDVHLLPKDTPIMSVDVNDYHPGTQVYGELGDYDTLHHLCVADIEEALGFEGDEDFENLFKTFSQIALQK
jgi:hypothetical protein